MSRSSPLTKLLVCGVSTAVSVTGAWFAYRHWAPESPTVLTVDTSEEVRRMVNERFAAAGDRADLASDGSYPPPLVREPLDSTAAERFFPSVTTLRWVPDPHVYARRSGHQNYYRSFREHPDGGWTMETNELGMRESAEVLTEKPDVRILVTGDSHTDGVCATEESFANVLESLLSKERPGQTVESLNAGAGGYNLYNYLGTFERFAYLTPDVYIVVVYGGNDFYSSMLMHHYFHHGPPFGKELYAFDSELLSKKVRSIGAQEMAQEVYFLNNPDDVQVAVDLACSISVELQKQCSDSGTELLFVYLPPPYRGQPQHFDREEDMVLAAQGLENVELGASDRIADGWLRFLEERGLAQVDLRGAFRAESDRLYWRKDHHLNVIGHQLVAELLLDRVRELAARATTSAEAGR